MRPKIKICGLTRPEEAAYLEKAGADYAGFVFYEKSRRNLNDRQARQIMEAVHMPVRKVAVTVSPDRAQIKKLQQMGFDIVQIHGRLQREALEEAELPVWYALNISDPQELEEKTGTVMSFPAALQQKITAIVVDGAGYGAGKTFNWQKPQIIKRDRGIFEGREFILAGGLDPSNVAEGIRLFHPDVVDVSSGVESAAGKDETLIREFIRKVKEHE